MDSSLYFQLTPLKLIRFNCFALDFKMLVMILLQNNRHLIPFKYNNTLSFGSGESSIEELEYELIIPPVQIPRNLSK